MPRHEFSEEILRFVETRIDSVPHLESLLLLRENPGVSWAEHDIAARVYVSRERAQGILQDLASHAFIVPSDSMAGGYVYSAAWDQGGLMEKLAVVYRSNLVQLAGLIHD